MAYGIIKVDTVTFTNDGIDKSVSISGLAQNPTFSGNVTVTGTLLGVTVTGTTASFTSGVFVNISGGTHTITSGVFAAGSAASPSISFTSDPDTGLYSPGADQLALSTSGTERLRIDSSGRLLVGTSGVILGSPQAIIEKTSSDVDILRVQCGATEISGNIAGLSFGHGPNGSRPKSAIGLVASGTYGKGDLVFYNDSADDDNSVSSADEKMRLGNSGRLLIGTSTSITGPYSYARDVQFNAAEGLQLSRFSADAFSSRVTLVKSRNATTGQHTALVSGDSLGEIEFAGSDGTSFLEGARIRAEVDNGATGTALTGSEMPSRLVFSTTADGASSPTEAMRIKNSRILNFANTPVYADNAAAKTGGLVDGDVYRKSDGTLMIVYT